MKVGFDNLNEHVISLDDFGLNWRFTDPNHSQLPEIHLQQLKPLDSLAAKFLWDFINDVDLHRDVPFKKGFFNVIDKMKIREGNESDVKKWLYKRALPFDKQVYLSWQPDVAMIVPWKLMIKYFDDFAYPVSDDLTVIDQSLTWALMFYHEDEIYFGTNKDFKPETVEAPGDFLW